MSMGLEVPGDVLKGYGVGAAHVLMQSCWVAMKDLLRPTATDSLLVR